MRVLEVVSDADTIARILHGARAPPAPPSLGQILGIRDDLEDAHAAAAFSAAGDVERELFP